MARATSPARVAHRRLLQYAPSLAVTAAIVALAAVGWYGFIAPASVQASSPPPPSALPTSLTVTANNYYFSATTNELSPNATITITFVDATTSPHTFTLSPVQGVAIPQSVWGNNVSSYFTHINMTPLISISLPLGNGADIVTENFSAPATGWYEFVCEVPGHFGLGMLNALGFGVPAPSNLTGGGTTVQVGWQVYAIAGTIVALVVLALVLGFVSGQRKGGIHEMPPERLGYPEEPPTAPLPSGPNAPPPPQPPPARPPA